MANWADISDVALLKRLRQSEEWLRSLCVELLKENSGLLVKQTADAPIQVVDGTVVQESGRTGSQWRILYSLQLPSLVCDFFAVTATIGKGNGESLNRVAVFPGELVLADAGYCSVAGIEYVRQRGADVLVRIDPQSFVAFSPRGARSSVRVRLQGLCRAGQTGQWPVVLHGTCSSFSGRACAVRKSGVENRRICGSLPVAFVSAAFAERASIRFGMALFPVLAHRTGQAHLAHPALGESFTISPTEGCLSE